MKRRHLISLVALCLALIALIKYGITQHKKIKTLEAESEYFAFENNQLVTRTIKQFNSGSKKIFKSEIYLSNASNTHYDSLLNSTALFLVFPKSACGVCYDVVMKELQGFVNAHPELIHRMICVTDKESLVDVKAYLSDFELSFNLWLRNNEFDLAIDEPGYPYMFNGEIEKDGIDIHNTLIPDKHDPLLTSNFLKQLEKGM